MTNNSLQYESLKIVLQYLDANTRFQISRRCPSIRTAEKLAPLHIDKLMLPQKRRCTEPMRIWVNSTQYIIGTVRLYPQGASVPTRHFSKNVRGGDGVDLDQFGFEDFSSESLVTLGDVIVKEDMQLRNRRMNYLIERDGRRIEDLEQRLEHVRQKSINDPLNMDYKRHLEHFMTIIQPYFNRRDNIPLQFTRLIQLKAVKSNGRKEIIQQFPNRKVYEIEKGLFSFLFGDRKNVSVGKLHIDLQFNILRFPVGISIRLRELIGPSFALCEALPKFVHESSFPLHRVHVARAKKPQLGDPQLLAIFHSIVTSARRLRVFRVDENATLFLENARNQIVEADLTTFVREDYLVLARKLLETRRPVGTCYSFGFKEEDMNKIREAMDDINQVLNAEPSGEQCCKVPMTETTELRVSYEQKESKWIIKFEVMAV